MDRIAGQIGSETLQHVCSIVIVGWMITFDDIVDDEWWWTDIGRERAVHRSSKRVPKPTTTGRLHQIPATFAPKPSIPRCYGRLLAKTSILKQHSSTSLPLRVWWHNNNKKQKQKQKQRGICHDKKQQHHKRNIQKSWRFSSLSIFVLLVIWRELYAWISASLRKRTHGA